MRSCFPLGAHELRRYLNARLERLRDPHGHGIPMEIHGNFHGSPLESHWNCIGNPWEFPLDAHTHGPNAQNARLGTFSEPHVRVQEELIRVVGASLQDLNAGFHVLVHGCAHRD